MILLKDLGCLNLKVRLKIKEAIKIAEDSFKKTDPSHFSGSEDELAAKLEYNMRKAGSVQTPFETIVASGPRSSLPMHLHHHKSWKIH